MMKSENQQPPQTQNVPVVTAQVIQPHYNTSSCNRTILMSH